MESELCDMEKGIFLRDFVSHVVRDGNDKKLLVNLIFLLVVLLNIETLILLWILSLNVVIWESLAKWHDKVSFPRFYFSILFHSWKLIFWYFLFTKSDKNILFIQQQFSKSFIWIFMASSRVNVKIVKTWKNSRATEHPKLYMKRNNFFSHFRIEFHEKLLCGCWKCSMKGISNDEM